MLLVVRGDETFWSVIQTACKSDPSSVERWNDRLVEALAKLRADEIISWDHQFLALAERACRSDLWAAAHLINGGTSADGFFDFRCWLIGMGSQVYAEALQHPDSLANVVRASWDPRGIDAEAKIHGAPRQAWLSVTRRRFDDYPVRDLVPKALEAADLDDIDQMEQRFPRLFSILAQT